VLALLVLLLVLVLVLLLGLVLLPLLACHPVLHLGTGVAS
jgi:hypothetical protein